MARAAVSRSGALLASTLALGVAAVILLAQISPPMAKPTVLARILYQEGPAQSPSMLAAWTSVHSGFYWGNFDCHHHGWDLDWDEPAQLDVCAGDTPQCIKIFKSCLLMNHPAHSRPTPEDCWCYHDAVELGCPALCADEIFHSYGELSYRCHGFDVYHECINLFMAQELRDEANSTSDSSGPETSSAAPEPEAAPPSAAAAAVFAPGALSTSHALIAAPALTFRPRVPVYPIFPGALDAASPIRVQQLLVDPDADPDAAEAALDEGPDADQEADGEVDAEPEEAAEEADVDAEAGEEEEGGEDELQFRQPAGSYVQEDNSATLIEPWQYNSPGVYEPREDELPFDDDDPRE